MRDFTNLALGVVAVVVLWVVLAGGGTLLSTAWNASETQRLEAEALLVQAEGLTDIADAVAFALRTMTGVLARAVMLGLFLLVALVALMVLLLTRVLRLERRTPALPNPPEPIQILIIDPTQQGVIDAETVGFAPLTRTAERQLNRR